MNGYAICQAVRAAKVSNGKHVATVAFDGTEHTYEEFHDRIAKAGTGMRKILGVKPQDPVAILSLNSVEYLEYFFSVSWAGAWVVPLNIRLAIPENADVLNDCEATALFVDDAFSPCIPELKKRVPSIQHIVYIGSKATPEGAVSYEEIISKSDPEPAYPSSGDDIYGIFYTGGTTGKSKGVLLSHTNLLCNAYGILHSLQYSKHSRYLHVSPMFHAADGASTFAATMVGATHVFMPKFDPQGTLDVIHERQISHVLLVPTMIAMVCALPAIDASKLSTLEAIIYGASAMPEALIKQAMSIFSNTRFYQGYGMTECAPVNTILNAEDHIQGGELLKAAGRPLPHVELLIVDEQGTPVANGVVGELIVRGPHVMKGYYRMPEQTAHALKNGWMHTGDGAVMNDAGYVFIKDRIKDMIVSGGENVYSTEVENAILKMEGVAAVAVIGTPDDKLVEKVTAIIVPKPGAKVDEASVIAHCRTLIAGYKCPRLVQIRQEPFPLSGAGKVLKNVLREPFWKDTNAEIYSDVQKETEYR